MRLRNTCTAPSLALLVFSRLSTAAFNAASQDNVAVYWGQNSYGASSGSLAQQRLSTYCADSNIDIIPLAFMTVITDSYGEPEINFANQGDKCAVFSGTNLLDCSELEEDITTCQQMYGKTILLSIGGATYSEGGFSSASEAQSAAQLVWATVGPEQESSVTSDGTKIYRPFGSAAVDGFDFDFESTVSNMAPFVQALRDLMDATEAADGKHRLLTAAPQCPYPDAADDQFLSGTTAVKMDAIFIQFYNNYCGLTSFASGSSLQNNFNYETWDAWAKSSANPNVKILIGVPASSTAAGSGYITASALEPIIDYVSTFNSFGGVMMWDASQAYANTGFLPAVKSYLVSLAGGASNSATSISTTSTTATATSSSLTLTSTVAQTFTSLTNTTSSTTPGLASTPSADSQSLTSAPIFAESSNAATSTSVAQSASTALSSTTTLSVRNITNARTSTSTSRKACSARSNNTSAATPSVALTPSEPATLSEIMASSGTWTPSATLTPLNQTAATSGVVSTINSFTTPMYSMNTTIIPAASNSETSPYMSLATPPITQSSSRNVGNLSGQPSGGYNTTLLPTSSLATRNATLTTSSTHQGTYTAGYNTSIIGTDPASFRSSTSTPLVTTALSQTVALFTPPSNRSATPVSSVGIYQNETTAKSSAWAQLNITIPATPLQTPWGNVSVITTNTGPWFTNSTNTALSATAYFSTTPNSRSTTSTSRLTLFVNSTAPVLSTPLPTEALSLASSTSTGTGSILVSSAGSSAPYGNRTQTSGIIHSVTPIRSAQDAASSSSSTISVTVTSVSLGTGSATGTLAGGQTLGVQSTASSGLLASFDPTLAASVSTSTSVGSTHSTDSVHLPGSNGVSQMSTISGTISTPFTSSSVASGVNSASTNSSGLPDANAAGASRSLSVSANRGSTASTSQPTGVTFINVTPTGISSSSAGTSIRPGSSTAGSTVLGNSVQISIVTSYITITTGAQNICSNTNSLSLAGPTTSKALVLAETTATSTTNPNSAVSPVSTESQGTFTGETLVSISSSAKPLTTSQNSVSAGATATSTTSASTDNQAISTTGQVTPITQIPTSKPSSTVPPSTSWPVTLEPYPQVTVQPPWPTPALNNTTSAARTATTASVTTCSSNYTYSTSRFCSGDTCTANNLTSPNIFASSSDAAPPSNIPRRADHPVSRSHITNTTGPLHTNKFHANLFLSSQTSSAWTHPYSVAWPSGTDALHSHGLAISHIPRSQFAFGDATTHNSSRYFFAPLGIHSLILSATELEPSSSASSSNATLSVTPSASGMAANATFSGSSSPGEPLLTFPLVQGMAFVTGVYHGATPLVQSGVGFTSVEGPLNFTSSSSSADGTGSMVKYRATLADGTTWLLYAVPAPGATAAVFELADSTALTGPAGWRGSLSVAKLPTSGGRAGEEEEEEAVYDAAAGAYPVDVEVFGSVDGGAGAATYGFRFAKGGHGVGAGRELLMYALPHHVASFDGATAAARTGLSLATVTKGYATAYVGDAWTMTEGQVPVGMGFAPYAAGRGSVSSLSAAAACAVLDAGAEELAQDVAAQTDLDSMYFSGKALAKFAAVVYAVHDLGGSAELAAQGLKKLVAALKVFVDNEQTNPLVYDEVWGGVVSSAGYADSGADFGNTYYNDHHFHYGYFLYTAAVIGYLDPDWLTTGTNKAWVDMLAADFASPTHSTYYPFSRSFDWFHGHSWAKGLFSSGDGKDQESSSEDAFASYALKLWGKVTGDVAMEARANLMLAVQARSFQSYFLMTSSNTIQPPEIINNKVTGVLFENKVDWATYFGDKWYYKEGIHMIPVHVPSALIRTSEFVAEEYDTYMSGGRIDEAEAGWRGILYANTALIEAKEAYEYFASANFSSEYLDGGASRTWYLAYTAALAGL